ncbi:MAG: FkbM family methyltransferase [Ferruginibacter sp.]
MQWAAYGVKYRRSTDFIFPGTLLIHGQRIQIKFPNATSREFLYEFDQICLQDCYRLTELKNKLKNIQNIVDVGANQGIFAIAARRHFPTASISCYEPNINLKTILDHNASALNVRTYYEAVTKEDCKVELHFGETDLHTVSKQADDGTVSGTSLETVITRAQPKIDILKLDCEGAEWELLEDTESWQKINAVTMEYHLWAKPNSSYEELSARFEELGFYIIYHKALSNTFGLLTAVRKRS